MPENEPGLLSERYENLIPKNSTLSNARTVYGEPVNETVGEIVFRNKLKVVAVVGEPGSGKTIISKEIANIVRKNRPDKRLKFFYYDDVHEFVQHITNTKSSSWEKLRNTNQYPDLWVLASTIAFYSILETLKDIDTLAILEGVFCGKEDRFRSTILKLINLIGEGSLGIIPVVPHPDTQQSAVISRDTASFTAPKRVIEILRSMNIEPNPDFKAGDVIAGNLVKRYLEKSATGAEIAEISHENRRIAEEKFLNISPDLIEIYHEILSRNVPDISDLPDFGETARIKALSFIDDFSQAGVEVTPLINLPMHQIINLYISKTTPKETPNTNFLKQLIKITRENIRLGQWKKSDIKNWFPSILHSL